MDFDDQSSPALEAFRQDVRSWVRDQAWTGSRTALTNDPIPSEALAWAFDFQRSLADRGWAVPSWSPRHGGGGLTTEHDVVLRQELGAAGVPPLFETNLQVAATVLAWGGEMQRRRHLRPLLRGDHGAWRSTTEADAVADPENVRARAERDGDDYIVTGGSPFFGGPGEPTHLWTLAVTEPDAPPHLSLSAFLIPVDLSGVAVSEAGAVAGEARRGISLQEVRVPVECRIGEEGDGWAAAQSSLETEAEAERETREQHVMVADLIRYTKETLRGRQPLFQYKHVRLKVVESYIETHVLRLLSLRNRWMRSEGQETTYHAAQYALMAKGKRLRLASTMLETMGPYTLLSDQKWAPMNGEAEAFQRASLPGAKPGDSIAVQERLMGSRLGLQGTSET